MKKIVFLFLFLYIGGGACGVAQNAKSKSGKSGEVTAEERALSVQFANALKDYYAANYRGAESGLQAVIGKNPKHATSFYILGKVKEEANDLAAAEHYYLQATELEKNNIWYMVALAELYDKQGKSLQASQLWEKICKMEPDNEYYLYYYSNSLFSQQRYKEVIKVYDQMEKIMGSTPELTQAKVELWLQLDNVKNAVAEYDKLIKAEPYCADNYIRAANIYVNNDMPEAAVPYFEKLLKINPNNAEIQFVMGNYYESKGDKEAAYEAWKAAFASPDVAVERKLPVLRKYLTPLTSQPATAKQYALCEALTSAHPNVLEGWAALASLYLSEHKYKEAASYFEKALQIDEAQYAIWEDYLYCLAQSESYQKILEKENDLVELFPSSSMIDFTLGTAHYYTGNYTKALSYYQHALTVCYDKKEIAHINNMISNVQKKLEEQGSGQE